MRKDAVGIFLFLVLIISACAPQAPPITAAPASTDAQSATRTETAASAVTPTVDASVTSTPTTPIPSNAPDCVNSAAFVQDVTVPDRSGIPAGTVFTKTWRVKNTGTCVWTPEYVLTHYSEENMAAPFSTPLSVAFPGETIDISVNLTAPGVIGDHTGFFVIRNPAGLIMKIDNDSRLWVVIDVQAALASAPTTAGTQGAGSIPITGDKPTSTSLPNLPNGLVEATCAYTSDAAKVTEAINAINAYRAANGLPAYTVNALLTVAAISHANDMACNKLFTHKGSDGSTPNTRVAKSGYIAAFMTENVYGSYPPLTGAGAVDWWKNDKTDIRHNQNLLSNVYTEIGMGYAFYNNFGYYVLVFAKSK